MVIDCEADIDHALQHEILDATSLQPLPMDGDYRHTWYADDQKGILRVFLVDEDGLARLALLSDPQSPLPHPLPDHLRCAKFDREGNCISEPICAAWREVKRPIRIVRKERFKEARQFSVGDVVYITPDKLYPKGLKARVVEVDGHSGDSGLLLCEWANEPGRLVTALHDPESLLLVEKAEHANQHQA